MRAHNKIEWAQRKEESNSNNNKSRGDGKKVRWQQKNVPNVKTNKKNKKKKRMRNERRKPRMLRVKGAARLLKDERPLESCKSELTAAAAAAVGNVYR